MPSTGQCGLGLRLALPYRLALAWPRSQNPWRSLAGSDSAHPPAHLSIYNRVAGTIAVRDRTTEQLKRNEPHIQALTKQYGKEPDIWGHSIDTVLGTYNGGERWITPTSEWLRNNADTPIAKRIIDKWILRFIHQHPLGHHGGHHHNHRGLTILNRKQSYRQMISRLPVGYCG